MAGPKWHEVTLPDGTNHADWLKANASKYTKKEIAKILGRSIASITGKLNREELEAKPEDITTITVDEIQGIPVDKFLGTIRNKARSRAELSRKFDRSEDTIEDIVELLQARAYEITRTVSEQVIWSTRATSAVEPPPNLWDETYGQFIIGKISDLHFGSKWQQISNLHRCIQEMYNAGVRRILVAGDGFAGLNVYRGQIHDLITVSSLEQVALGVEYLPRYEGLEYRFIGGNHDFSFIKQNGYNPVRDLCDKRSDCEYCGFDLADVPITPLVDARLWHPMGGVPYAYSYRMQKHVEEMAFGELLKVLQRKESPRVRILHAGHLHIAMDFWAGPILCIQTGCFEGQTPYLKRKGKTPFIGGTILEFQITSSQTLRNVCYRQLRFDEIDNDYLEYPIPREKEIELEPWFEWIGDEEES